MLAADARDRLAERQSELVRALTSHGPPPDGFDPERVSAAARSLFRKRLRVVADVWPVLASALGAEFETLFTEYALTLPMPAHGAGLADGRGFARYLDDQARLPDEGRLVVASYDLERHCLGLTLIRLRQQRRWLLGLRLPWLGQRWLTLPG